MNYQEIKLENNENLKIKYFNADIIPVPIKRTVGYYDDKIKNDIASADSGLYRAQNDIKLHEEHIESCSARLKNMHAQLDEFDSAKI